MAQKALENICSQHHKVKEMFCCTDQQLICMVCCTEQHQGHRTVSAAAERNQRQGALESRRTQLLKSVQDKETDLRMLQQEAQNIKRSAQKALQLSGDSFTEMIHLLEVRRSEVEQQIRSQQETELRRVQELREELQQNITEIKMILMISEIDTLSLTPDHSQFLQNYPSLSTDTQSPQSPRIQTGPRRYFEEVTSAVSALRDQLQLTLNEAMTNISLCPVDSLLSPAEPRTRKDFLRYASEITLDLNTAYTELSLSDENRRVTFMNNHQPYPDHPDRFSAWGQVLSREAMTGRSYWEVEWIGTYVCIGVSYRDIKRKGGFEESIYGHNNKSWALRCDGSRYTLMSNSVQSNVSGPISSRIGVYLDHSAGALSFYSVQNQTMTLLHRVTSATTFTQPLYTGIRLHHLGDTAHFPKLK